MKNIHLVGVLLAVVTLLLSAHASSARPSVVLSPQKVVIEGEANFIPKDHFILYGSGRGQPKVVSMDDNFTKHFLTRLPEAIPPSVIRKEIQVVEGKDFSSSRALGLVGLLTIGQFYKALAAQNYELEDWSQEGTPPAIIAFISLDDETWQVAAVWSAPEVGWLLSATPMSALTMGVGDFTLEFGWPSGTNYLIEFSD